MDVSVNGSPPNSMLELQDPNSSRHSVIVGRGSTKASSGVKLNQHSVQMEMSNNHSESGLVEDYLELGLEEQEMNESMKLDFSSEESDDYEPKQSRNIHRRVPTRTRRNSSSDEDEFIPQRNRNVSLADELDGFQVLGDHDKPEIGIQEGLAKFSDGEETQREENEEENFEIGIKKLQIGLEDTRSFLSILKVSSGIVGSNQMGTMQKGNDGEVKLKLSLSENRENVVESMGKDLLSNIQSSTKVREGQIKELIIIEKLSNQIPLAILATLEPIDIDAETEELVFDLGQRGEPETFEEELFEEVEDLEPFSPALDSNDRFETHLLPPSTSSTISEISSLQNITNSLISTLSTLNEKSQMERLKSKEINSKIKMISNRISNFQSEEIALQNSQLFVQEYESKRKNNDVVEGSERKFRKEMAAILLEVDGLLEIGERRASEILVV